MESLESTPVPEEGRNQRKTPYSPLAVTVLSAVLENDREISRPELYQKLEGRGVTRKRAAYSVNRILFKNGNLQVANEIIMTTEMGLDYMACNISKLEEAEEKATQTQEKFAPAQYSYMSVLEKEAQGKDGWLFDGHPSGARPVMDFLEKRLNSSTVNLQRTMSIPRKSGYIEQQLGESESVDGGGKRLMNLRLTQEGKADLQATRDKYPEEVAKLEAAEAAGVKADELRSHWEDTLTAQAMSKEVNHMRVELGEEQQDFVDIISLDASDTLMLIDSLSETMKKLERRLNAHLPPSRGDLSYLQQRRYPRKPLSIAF